MTLPIAVADRDSSLLEEDRLPSGSFTSTSGPLVVVEPGQVARQLLISRVLLAPSSF